MSFPPDGENRLKHIILEAAGEATGGRLNSPNLEAAARQLAASTNYFLDALSHDFPPTVDQGLHLGRFASGLLVAVRRSQLNAQVSNTTNPGIQAVGVLREPLSLHVLNGDQPTRVLSLDDQQRVMLAHFAAATLTDLNRHINPRISRQRVENSSGGAFTLSELRRRLFDPLQETGIVESSNDGFLLNASLRTVRQALIAPDEALIRVIPFDKWQQDEFGKILIPAALAPTVDALAQIADQRLGNERILMEQLSEMTGKKIDAIKRDLRILKGLNLLAAGIRSRGTRVADVSGYIHTISHNLDKPPVGVTEVSRQQMDPNESSDSIENKSNTQKVENKKPTEANPFLLINMRSHSDVIEQVARLNRPAAKTHLPSALKHPLRRLNTLDDRNQFPWEELNRLGLVRQNRDHHFEMYPVSALIALFKSFDDVAEAARLIANGSKKVVETIAIHTSHILIEKYARIDNTDLESSEKEKMVKFLEGSIQVLKECRLQCECSVCSDQSKIK